MVWNAQFYTYKELNANEREHATSFLIDSIASHDLIDGQRCFVFGQAMDFKTLVWFFIICLVVHQYDYVHLLSSRAKNYGHGAKEMPNTIHDEDFKPLFCIE